MPDQTEPKDLEMVLAKLKAEWRELADLLTSQDKSHDRVIELEKILLRDAADQYRGKISANPDGSADLLLTDRSGNAWVRLGVNQDGEAFLELKDKQGESSFKVGVGAPSSGAGAGLAAAPEEAAPPAAPQPRESPDAAPQAIMPVEAAGEPQGESASEPTPPPPGQDVHPAGDANFAAMDRLEKLERQNRRRTMYWALILAVVGVILATQAYVFFRPISSGSTGAALMVRDANGKVRASLDTNGGQVNLEMWDPEGHRRAIWGWGPRGLPIWRFMTGSSGSGPS